MPDEPNTIEDAPIADTPQNSEPQAPVAPPESPEAPPTGVIAESNKEAPPIDHEIRVETGNEQIPLEPADTQASPASNGTSEPIETPTAQSAPAPEELKGQTSTNDPLDKTEPVKVEPLNPEPVQAEVKPVETKSQSSPQTEAKSSSVVIPPVQKNLHELRVKELLALKNKTRKRIKSVMNLFSKKAKIRNDDVEKFLHVSDATATRYLSQLEKEGKIQKNVKKGKLGKWVSYFKI